VTGRSAEIAFFLLLAIFPFMISVISLLGLVGSSSFIHPEILTSLRGIIPDAVYSILNSILQEIASSQNITFLSFSMLGVIWAASKGFSVILRGLSQIYHTGNPVSSLILRLLGLLFAFVMILTVLLVMILITFGDLLFNQLAVWSGLDFLAGTLLQFGRYAFSFIFLLLIFSLLYYLVSKRKARYRLSIPAAAFTAASWLIFSGVFSWYLNNFARYARLYGSLASIMILMLWLYFCSIVILTGGIIHEKIIEYKNQKDLKAKGSENQ
jgi:membrane protein